MREGRSAPEGVPGAIRGAILAILALGTTAMAAELLLVRHFEDANQWIPLAEGAVGLVLILWCAIRPGVAAIRALQFVMLTFIATGIIGITLHFSANAEAQREIDPALGGTALFWKAVESTAPPALAPGIMVQLGLLGLLYSYKHPSLGEDEGFEQSA